MRLEVNNVSLSEQNLSEQSVSFDNLIDFIPALVVRVDCNMAVQYANRSFRKWFSRIEDPSCNSFPVIIGRQIFNQIQRYLGKTLVGEPAHLTISFPHGGEYRCMEVNILPEFDYNQKVKGFIFYATDITSKLDVERSLHDYFENATIGLHWVNEDGIIIWANREELTMLGYEPDEYIGQPITRFHKNQQVIQEILYKLRNKEIIKNSEAELLCKDGSSRFVTINSSVLWKDGEFVHTRCFTIDITAQKLAAKAMRENQERFKVMSNLVPVIIWTTDENGLCTFLNSKWSELTGKKKEDGLGSLWLNIIHPDDRRNIETAWRKSLSEKKTFEAKFRIENSTGRAIVVYANSIPQFDVNNRFTGYTGIIQDISVQEEIKSSLEKMVLNRTDDLRKRNLELRKAEKALILKNHELEKINNELSSFAHIASHDLQEPLRKIQTFIDRVVYSDGDKLSSRSKEYIDKIQSASNRMRVLIKDILLYSKTTNAESGLELTDLNQLLEEVVTEFEVKIEQTGARIENNGLPTLPVTRFQFHQVFLNLISNALKFSKEFSTPHIVFQCSIVPNMQLPGMHDPQDFYDISVSDNGIGFQAEYAEKIFEIFNRLHSKSQVEGTGIGLAICKKIIEGHHGRMTAEGKINEGAIFHIYLPVHKQEYSHRTSNEF
jgi:PAS domain S-box-containing protein